MGGPVHHDARHTSPPHRAHDAHAGHSPAMFRDRFWISAALTVPAVIWSAPIQVLLHYWAPLVTIMLLGHWIEMRSIQRAEGALAELAKLLPDAATRVRDGTEEEVPIGALRTGEIVLVRPGESVPVDGVVRKGESDVNESMITGESRPVKKGEGDEVIAGTINGQGALRVEVMGTGADTKLSRIMRFVAEAQRSKSRAQVLADRAAQMLTGVAIAAALLTMVVWQLLGAPIDFAVVRVVTVLVIACPHALGLAVPLVVAISTTLGARAGLLVRDRRGSSRRSGSGRGSGGRTRRRPGSCRRPPGRRGPARAWWGHRRTCPPRGPPGAS